MVQILVRAFPAAFYLVACIVVASIAQAVAQTEAPKVAKSKVEEVPQPFLARILDGAGGTAVIEQFLLGDGAPAELVAKRAAAVIRQLGAQRSILEAEDLLEAVDRVVHVAARSFSYTTVLRTAVAQNYRPDDALLAWDFGPPDGKVMPGFDHILPNDERISGGDIAAHVQISNNSLLADGLSGVRKIRLNLADGTYRIILITRDPGESTVSNLPFGREVRANGVTMIVSGKGPATWVDQALLARSGLRLAGGSYKRAGIFLTGDLASEIGELYKSQLGGAVVFEGTSSKGTLVIELGNFGHEKSYLTGLIIETPDTLSDLILSRTALNSFIPRDVRIALEAEILLVAAEAVQGIAPAAGQIFESDNVVTAN